MKTLLIHGHLIIDDYRQFLDGSLLVDDKHILEVYPQYVELDDVSVVDLKGKLVFPKFLDLGILDEYQVVVDPLDNIKTDKKIMLGNSKAYMDEVHIEYDGYYDLFNNMTGFSVDRFGLVNGAFNDDRYVELDSSLDETILSVVYRLKRKDRIILIGNIEEGIRKMYKLGANFNELLMMSSLNAYRLFGLDKQRGSLIKGKSSAIETIGDLDV